MADNSTSPLSGAAAIVLTGGKSTRMGVDKATLVVDGVRLVDRVIAAVRSAGIDRIVVAGPPISELDPSIEVVPDPTPHTSGPLAGIVSAWATLRMDSPVPDPILVISCDLPRLTPAVLAALRSDAERHTHGSVAHDGERQQPLVAGYRVTALDAMTEAFGEGERSVRRLFKEWDLGSLPIDARLVADADAPSDLEPFTVAWPTKPTTDPLE